MDPERTSPILTFLFTDIEGSSRLWEQFPDAMPGALERHDAILTGAVHGAGGRVVKTTGDGIMAVFRSAARAVQACLDAQRRLADEPWGPTGALRVRMGLHSGEAQVRDEDYFGAVVVRTARLMAVAHGGQVLLSEAASALVVDRLPPGVALLDQGVHRLKDLDRPERVFQLTAPDLAVDFPPLATPGARTGALPHPVSSFVGRRQEVAQVTERLTNDAVRLLTLTGPGGTGKTRLAMRVAADAAGEFEDGVVFVDLAPVTAAGAVAPTLARALGLPQPPERSVLDVLVEHLRARRELLLLDNFEQVTAAAGDVAELLSECPRLKVLVTSRQPLHVRGEHVFPVPPLSLPLAAAGATTAVDLAGSEAVELFLDRAREVRPGFVLTDRNAPVVADICRRLDGLPLAIELAAARLNLLTPEAVLDRLGSRLRLLRGGAADLPERQRTLRATIEWSYQLLTPGEQSLLELLSVFAGADVEAIETVAGNLSWVNRFDVLDGLASLADKSLVRVAETGGGIPRVLLLETIREFAAEHLEASPGQAADARRAHATYFSGLASRQHDTLVGRGGRASLARLLADVDNLLAAWRYWRDTGNLDELDRLVDALWVVAEAHGWYQLTVELTTDLLRALSTEPATADRAAREATLRATAARALLAIKGWSPEVEEAYSLALDLVERERLPRLFPVLASLAAYYTTSGDADTGISVGHEILRLADMQDDPAMSVDGHLAVAANLLTTDLRGALEHLDAGIATYRSLTSVAVRPGVDPGVASLAASSFVLTLMGYPDRGLQRTKEAVALGDELGHPYTRSYALFHAGYLHSWRREPERMRQRAIDLLRGSEKQDFPVWNAVGTCLLGAANVLLGAHAEGLAQLREGLQAYRGLQTPPVFWPLLLTLHAAAHGHAGRPVEGLAAIDEAVAVVDPRPAGTLAPEVYLVKGDLLRALAPAGGAEAERWFQRAFDIAEALDVRMSRLRAATRLSGLWAERGERRRGLALLGPVYADVREGFTMADVRDAEAVLGLPPATAPRR